MFPLDITGERHQQKGGGGVNVLVLALIISAGGASS